MVLADLQGMLRGLEPTLDETPYVFASTPDRSGLETLSGFARGLFRRRRRPAFILPSEVARAHGLPAEPRLCRIVLKAHSSLEGVGLTARVSSALASAGVACNIVAALHHDHLFVPEGAATHALGILRSLQRQARQVHG
jgi:uncharacterized protein